MRSGKFRWRSTESGTHNNARRAPRTKAIARGRRAAAAAGTTAGSRPSRSYANKAISPIGSVDHGVLERAPTVHSACNRMQPHAPVCNLVLHGAIAVARSEANAPNEAKAVRKDPPPRRDRTRATVRIGCRGRLASPKRIRGVAKLRPRRGRLARNRAIDRRGEGAQRLRKQPRLALNCRNSLGNGMGQNWTTAVWATRVAISAEITTGECAMPHSLRSSGRAGGSGGVVGWGGVACRSGK